MDLSAGLAASVDEVTAATPTDPQFREGTSIWVWDDAGRLSMPRLAIEVVGATWETARQLTGNITLPEGRVLRIDAEAPALPAQDASGRPRVLGAGAMAFECLEPFVHWRFRYEGEALSLSVEEQIAGRALAGADRTGLGSAPVSFDLDMRMTAPAWAQGSLGGKGFVPSEDRFEQLFKMTGQARIDGQYFDLSGGGLRVHRKGGARTPPGDFFGHSWHSAFFPSGRAFGVIHYHPRPDGSAKFCEGWVMHEDGQVLPAEIVGTPWIRDMRPRGEDVSFTFRTARGDVRIEGETHATTFTPARKTAEGETWLGASIFTNLQQGTARYRWGDEEAFGMIERSYLS
jgi:hypothetical protein